MDEALKVRIGVQVFVDSSETTETDWDWEPGEEYRPTTISRFGVDEFSIGKDIYSSPLSGSRVTITLTGPAGSVELIMEPTQARLIAEAIPASDIVGHEGN
jgi:hypothetical protein